MTSVLDNKEMREALELLDGLAALKREQKQQQAGMLQVCMECCGTILPHSTGGAERGTCHCARGPGRIKAMLFYGGDPRKYGVEWEGAVIAVHPPTLLRAVVVLYDLRAEWIALHESELRTVCAWCSVLLHDGVLPVSHGICTDCSERVFGSVDVRWLRDAVSPPSQPVSAKVMKRLKAVAGRRWPAWVSLFLPTVLLCAHGLSAQVTATAELRDSVAEIRVGNPTAGPLAIEISLYRDATKGDGPITLGDSVSAIISPHTFTLQPGTVQVVRVRVREAVKPNEMLRLATMFTPLEATGEAVGSMRLLIRTRLITRVLAVAP